MAAVYRIRLNRICAPDNSSQVFIKLDTSCDPGITKRRNCIGKMKYTSTTEVNGTGLVTGAPGGSEALKAGRQRTAAESSVAA
jgi:hypothetical protein